MRLIPLFATVIVTASMALTGCNATETKTAKAQSTEVKNEMASSSIALFEAHHEGRINQFYDQKTFESFMSVGETAYRFTRIGAGPNGETMVFGVSRADKNKGGETPAAMLWDGKLDVSNFYGEMYKHGRIYVFNNKADMDSVRKIGEPSFMFTEIGSGPNGETVVYVLNKNTKKQKPVDLIAQFKSMH